MSYIKRPTHTNTNNRLKLRCCIYKCKKLGKDIIGDKVYCRIHSPMREGFATRIKMEKNK